MHLFLCASIATHARFFMLGFFIQLGSTSDAIKQTRLKVCRHSWFYCHTERPSVNISFIFYILKRARVVFTRYYLWNNFFLFLCLGPSSNNVLGKILFENITTTRYTSKGNVSDFYHCIGIYLGETGTTRERCIVLLNVKYHRPISYWNRQHTENDSSLLCCEWNWHLKWRCSLPEEVHFAVKTCFTLINILSISNVQLGMPL